MKVFLSFFILICSFPSVSAPIGKLGILPEVGIKQGLCGGAFVEKKWFFTAAHCVTELYNGVRRERLPVERVMISELDNDLYLGNPININIPSNFYLPDGDIAILEMSMEVEKSYGLSQVCGEQAPGGIALECWDDSSVFLD